MKLVRDSWQPLTIVVETHEEAEILHKIIAMVSDQTEGRDGNLVPLFMALGKGLDADSAYRVSGELTIKDYC